MKEKILESILRSLCEGFGVQFLKLKDFEEGLATLSEDFLKEGNQIADEYNKLKNSKSKTVYEQLLSISKEDYIKNGFRQVTGVEGGWGRHQIVDPPDKSESLAKFRKFDEDQYNSLKDEYEKYLKTRDNEIFIPFINYIVKGWANDLNNENKGETNLSIKKIFSRV